MIEFQEFIANQNRVYDDIRKSAFNTRVTGLEHDPNLEKRMGGFFITLEHPPVISQAVENLSRKVAQTVPAIVYHAEVVHTSLGSYYADFGFMANPNKPEHKEILEKMSEAVESVIFTEPCFIDYLEYIHTSRVVIAAGVPSKGFVHLVDAITSACQKRRMSIKPAWGAHITLNRFTRAVPAENLGEFFKLFQDIPSLGESCPTAIQVGYANWSQEELCGHFTKYQSFRL